MEYVYVMEIMCTGLMFFSSKEKALKYANDFLKDAPGISKIKSFNALDAYDGWGKKIKLDNGQCGLNIHTIVE